MPLPILFIAIAAATGAIGAGASAKAALDTREAKRTNESANNILDSAKNRLNFARKRSGKALETLGSAKIDILNNSIMRFVHSFERLKNVNLKQSTGLNELNKFRIDRQSFVELKELGGFASSIAGGVAGGTLGGVLTAFGAYSMAGSFASASTGTAIATLSGIAAKNATLAFFGGGSLAAGGLGMAGGVYVLGGLVAGPALAIMGSVFAAKAGKAKDEAYANLATARKSAAELDTMSDLCYAITQRCDMFLDLLKRLDKYFLPQIVILEEAIREHGTNFEAFSSQQKEAVAASVCVVGCIKSVLDTPLLTKDGALTVESARILKEVKVPQYSGQSQKVQAKQQNTAYTGMQQSVVQLPNDLNQIVQFCTTQNVYTRGKYGQMGEVRWNDLLQITNQLCGTDLTVDDAKEVIKDFGKHGNVEISDLDSDWARLVLFYQLGFILNSCSSCNVLVLDVIPEDAIDWEVLKQKLFIAYGVKVEKWQMTSSKYQNRETEEIAVNSILETIMYKMSFDTNYYLSAEAFKQATASPVKQIQEEDIFDSTQNEFVAEPVQNVKTTSEIPFKVIKLFFNHYLDLKEVYGDSLTRTMFNDLAKAHGLSPEDAVNIIKMND